MATFDNWKSSPETDLQDFSQWLNALGTEGVTSVKEHLERMGQDPDITLSLNQLFEKALKEGGHYSSVAEFTESWIQQQEENRDFGFNGRVISKIAQGMGSTGYAAFGGLSDHIAMIQSQDTAMGHKWTMKNGHEKSMQLIDQCNQNRYERNINAFKKLNRSTEKDSLITESIIEVYERMNSNFFDRLQQDFSMKSTTPEAEQLQDRISEQVEIQAIDSKEEAIARLTYMKLYIELGKGRLSRLEISPQNDFHEQFSQKRNEILETVNERAVEIEDEKAHELVLKAPKKEKSEFEVNGNIGKSFTRENYLEQMHHAALRIITTAKHMSVREKEEAKTSLTIDRNGEPEKRTAVIADDRDVAVTVHAWEARPNLADVT